MKRKHIILTLFLLSLLVLSACTGGLPFVQRSTDNPNRNYYVGNDGVIMRFSDPTSPPARMYYYSDAPTNENNVQILVDVHNIGSSWTMGALFVSGFDPSIIRFENVNVQRVSSGWDNCLFNFFGAGGGNNIVSGNCPGVGSFGFGDDQVDLYLRDIGSLLGLEDSVLNGVAIDFSNNNGNWVFGTSIDDLLDADVFNHGRGLVMAMSAIPFNYNGVGYQGSFATTEELRPDDPDFPGGEVTTVAFNGWVEDWPEPLDQKTETFLITNCFVYSTYAAPQVCIDPAPYDQGRKVCVPRKINFNGGNGAPVAINVVEQENTRRSVIFDIQVRNVGGGTIFDLGSMPLCSPWYGARLTSQHLDRVYLLDARIGDQQLDCNPDRGDGIRMTNGRGQFTCTYTLEYVTARSAYTTPLILELGYGYGTTMQRTVNIKRVI